MKKTLIVLGCMSLGLAHAQQGRTHAQHNGADARVGINTENPVATLELKKVEGLEPTRVQGFLLPHLTQEERNEMEKEALVNGLMIFNTTKNCIDWWDGVKWACTDGSQVDRPTPKLPTTTPITLPANLTITDGTHWIASILDNNYLPFTMPDTPASWTEKSNPNTTGTDENIDVKGQVPATGITVKIPVTITSGSPVLPAYTTYAVTEAEAWKDGQAKILELSWPQQTITATNKTITATIKVKDATTNQELTQLDLRNGLGNDNLGLLLGQFKMPKNNSETALASYTGTYDVRVISGIPDKNINKEVDGQKRHRFLYLPVKGPDGNLWLNNNLGADYANLNSPHFNHTKQAETPRDYKAYGSLFQFGRDGDGHELMTWTSSTAGKFVKPGLYYPIAEASSYHYTIETDPCPEGWAMPTADKFDALWTLLRNNHIANHYGLNLSTAGLMYHRYGYWATERVGQVGVYWTTKESTRDNKYSQYNYFAPQDPTYATLENNRSTGTSIRCVKN